MKEKTHMGSFKLRRTKGDMFIGVLTGNAEVVRPAP